MRDPVNRHLARAAAGTRWLSRVPRLCGIARQVFVEAGRVRFRQASSSADEEGEDEHEMKGSLKKWFFVDLVAGEPSDGAPTLFGRRLAGCSLQAKLRVGMEEEVRQGAM